MGSVKEYFSNLGSGIASLVKGMQVTGKLLKSIQTIATISL